MKLTPNQIADIEMTASQDTVAEVRQTAQGLIVTKRPLREEIIQFPYPILLCSDSPCQVTITIQGHGAPVSLGTFTAPANYWLEALKGYRNEETTGEAKPA